MDLDTVLAHPKVTGVRFEGDQNLATVFIKAFDDHGRQFPISFDEVWRFVGYGNKANGVKRLKHGGFKEEVDYIVTKERGHVVSQVSGKPLGGG